MNTVKAAGAVLIGAAFAVTAGCGRNEPDATANKPGDTVMQDVRQGAQSAAATTERYAEKGGALLDDATITAKIKTQLIAEPGLKGLSIDVDTSANVVTLNGMVSSEEARKQAEQIAQNTEGVTQVKNNLTVKPAGAS